MVKKILIINGPNLNLLGEREENKYGKNTLDEVKKNCETHAGLIGIEIKFEQSKNVLISNVTASEISDKNEIRKLLIDQIENRVRWRESVNYMIKNDVNHFIEIGPGKILSGLVKRINKTVKIDTINNENDINKLKI